MKFIKVFTLANCIALLGVSCQKKAQEGSNEIVASPTIEATKVLSLQPVKPVLLPGELLAWHKIALFSKVKGFLKEIKVDRGSVVRKGQILAVLDAPEVVTELDQARGQLNAATASLQETKARFSATKLTYGRLLTASQTQGAIALHELDLAKAKMFADSSMVATAQGNLAAAQSHFHTKAELVKYLNIVAPFNGTIVERNVSPGALIGAGDANGKPLFVLEDNQTLRLTVAIPEVYSAAVHNNNITFKVNSVLHKDFKASFGRSAESILEKNRVMMTEFDVDNRRRELKTGMYAEVQLPIKRTSPTLFVPTTAIVNSSEKMFVIRENHHKAEWVAVKTGISIDSLTEVFGDLRVGERLVAEASEELREGQPIQLRK